MTTTGGTFRRNAVAVGAIAAIVCAGGTFALIHRHAHAKEPLHTASTKPSMTTKPATTRAVVKHKKKQHK